MYFVNFRKKFSFSFLTFLVVLLSVASVTVSASESSAKSNSNSKKQETSFADLRNSFVFGDTKENERFDFLQSNPAIYFNNKFIKSDLFNSENSTGKDRVINNQTKTGNVADKLSAGESTIFNEFDLWVKSFAEKTQNGLQLDTDEINRGEQLAILRRDALKQLIETNPQSAIQKAIPIQTLQGLPSFITDNSERHISATGDFLVYAVDGINLETGKKGVRMTGSRTYRQVVIGDNKYEAYVYGRRETMTIKMAIPLSGIVIDNVMAVDENPARILSNSEAATLEASRQSTAGKSVKGRLAIDKSAAGENSGITAEIGGKVLYFASRAELDSFVNEEVSWEGRIGPERPTVTNDEGEQSTNKQTPEQRESSKTEGAKTVLMIRVDFSDKPGDPLDYYNSPLTLTRAQNLFTNEVNPFYAANSYGKISLTATVTPMLIRMPQPESYYIQGNNIDNLIPDARVAAEAKGYDFNNYDLDMIAFNYTPAFDWVGLSTIGDIGGSSTIPSKGSKLNGGFNLREVAHELGHNFGLLHANVWHTTDGTVIGQGLDDENQYSDCYDMMSVRCPDITINSHFNATYKRLLDWLTDANVQTVTGDGIYKIYAQDSPSQGGIRALKINKNSQRNYWIEFRQVMNGALIRWDLGEESFRQTELLDMNPSTDTINDAALSIGQQFNDTENNIKITVLSKDTSTTPVSLNVKVEFTQQGRVCSYSLSSTSAPIPVGGGLGSTNIITQPDCDWAASTSDSSWLVLYNNVTGTGSGTVNFNVISANPGSNERTGTININGLIFSVTQASGTTTGGGTGGNCTYSLNPSSQSVSPSGGAGFFSINSQVSGCTGTTYSAVSNASWVTISTPTVQTSGNINYTVTPNTGPLRNGSITVTNQATGESQTFNITQAAAAACSFNITSSSQDFPSSGGSGTVTGTTQIGCTVSATSGNAFVTVNSVTSSNMGNGTLSFTIPFTVDTNSSSARTGSINIGGQNFTVNQAAAVVSKSRKRIRIF